MTRFRKVIAVALVAFLAATVFGYGFGVGYYHWPPFGSIQAAAQTVGWRAHGPGKSPYYEARAAGGTALIVMEPIPVHPTAGVTPQNYRFDDDRFVPGLRAVADAVHQHATLLVSQLYHLGPNADPTATMRELWSVSGGLPPGVAPGRMREIDANDRRRRRISPTPAGSRKLRAGLRAAEQADDDVLGTLEPRELDLLRETMLRAYRSAQP